MSTTDLNAIPDQSAGSQELDRVVIRFAGDSGDGVQTIGDQLGLSSAVAGNDIATLPDFPAEIRAPAGTVYGVSGFQMQFAKVEAATAGDDPDVLVVFNPAALRKNLADLPKGGVIIADTSNFTDKNLGLVGYADNPLEDDSLQDYQVHKVAITDLTVEALKPMGLKRKEAKRCSNFFALGLTYWIYSRPLGPTLRFIEEKFGKKKAEIAEANITALKSGYHYGETAEAFQARYHIPKNSAIEPGTYRSINGTQALAMGLVTAAHKSGLELFFAGYPITPASDILHHLSGLRGMGARTYQAEDEIAAIGAAIGAAYAGGLAVTASAGPGIALKGEFLGLAMAVELPLVVINVQRGGPSTGLPTKMEQADLMQALYGRHGESPIPVIAANGPADAFDAAIEAARIALRSMSPVMLLCDGNIAFGSEPWRIPASDEIPAIPTSFQGETDDFLPYDRNDDLARPWAIPGTKGLEHRIGGIEREHRTGHISYDPDNHQFMTDLRQAKVDRIAEYLPPMQVAGSGDGDLLVISWGSPFGPVSTAVDRCRSAGLPVDYLDLRYLCPLPRDLGAVLARYRRVLVTENNAGQLSRVLRATYLIDVHGFNQVRGLPFKVVDVEAAIRQELEDLA